MISFQFINHVILVPSESRSGSCDSLECLNFETNSAPVVLGVVEFQYDADNTTEAIRIVLRVGNNSISNVE